jgi:hypothetical protein
MVVPTATAIMAVATHIERPENRWANANSLVVIPSRQSGQHFAGLGPVIVADNFSRLSQLHDLLSISYRYL